MPATTSCLNYVDTFQSRYTPRFFLISPADRATLQGKADGIMDWLLNIDTCAHVPESFWHSSPKTVPKQDYALID